MKNNTQKVLITIGIFAAFFLFGFLDNLKGPTIPFIIKGLNLNYSLMGNILFLEYVGFFVATFMTGIAIFRFGIKNILLASSLLFFIGIALASGIPVYLVLLGAFLVLGLGLGIMEVAGYSTIVIFHNEDKGKFLNLLTAFYGAGSMLVPLYAGALLSANISWRVTFAFCLLPIFLVGFFLIIIRFPAYERKKEASIFALIKSAFSLEMVLHYLALSFYTAVEIGLAAWMVEYIFKIKGQPFFFSSITLSIYFGLITVGRLCGSFVVDRIGHLRVLFLASLSGLLSLVAGIYGPNYLVLFIPGTGLFFSIIFPTITASFTDIKKTDIQKYLGFLLTFGGIGGMVGPWLVGLFGAVLKLSNSITLLVIFEFLMLVSIGLLIGLKSRFRKRENI